MLKFWRKPGLKDKLSEPISSGLLTESSSGPCNCSLLDADETSCFLAGSETDTALNFSRLSKPLNDIIRDSESLAYFIQYLEAMNVSVLVKCLKDIGDFNYSLAGYYDLAPLDHCKEIQKMFHEAALTTEPSNGLNYTNKMACDITRFSPHDRLRTSSRRSVITSAVSEAKLTEMQTIEQEMLANLCESEKMTRATVEGMKLFCKYFSHVAPCIIIVADDVFRRMLNNLRTDISHTTFADVRQLLFSVLEIEYYMKYLRSDIHCKYQMGLLTSCDIMISDILYNESALFYFMEYLENEGCSGLLEFWISANTFQKQFEHPSQQYDPTHAQDDAMVLYNKFFSLQASHPLNLGDRVRFLVEESICREGGPTPNCFDVVQRLIVQLLQKKFLKPFLQSEIYFKYLGELIATERSGPSRPGGSDCSSEISISTTSSPIMSESADSSRRRPNLSIDTRSLNDPDSLWRRTSNSGLTLGRVSSLGRFQTGLEPGPDPKIGLETRITKAMKKLVNMEEDKSKEELAWQVAEMIVKDVTNLTMPHSSHHL